MPDFRDVAAAGANLAVTIGIIEAATDEAPEEVKRNLEGKVDAVHEYLVRETDEFIQFGEVFDDGG